MRNFTVILIVLALAIVAAVPAFAQEAEETPGSIVDIAVNDGRFETLVAAVTAAGLADTLASSGDFTVFAPTDDAFAMLPEGTVEALLNDIPTLTDILLYHVVPGSVYAADVVTLESAEMANGLPVSIMASDMGVYLNDTTQVIITDIEASNGIIHVIDAVILPPSMTEAAAEDEMAEEEAVSEEAEAEEEMMDAKSIAEIAIEDGRFTTLVAAVEAAAEELGYPIIIKSCSGGRGRGGVTVGAGGDEQYHAAAGGGKRRRHLSRRPGPWRRWPSPVILIHFCF